MKTSVTGRLKRTLCAALALGMLLGLSPAYVRAANDTVTYRRANPEVAILNAYNGNDASFYTKKLKGNTDGNESDRAAYWQYNAVTLFKLDNGNGAAAQYSTRATNDTTWAFNLDSGSVLKQLIQPSKNLEVNASATFYNRTHTHSHFQLSSFRNWETTITSFESMGIGIAGSYGTSIAGSMDRSRQYPRIGDLGGTGGGYRTLNYYENKNYCSLHFYPSVHQWHDFEDRECTCGKTWAENVLVTFRDTRAPQLVDVQYKIDNGAYASFNKGASLGLGKTVSIKLSFDEPIRFADDSAAGKGALCLDLQAKGETGGKYLAKLVELSGNDLIFQYTLEKELDVEIAAISMGSLFASDATLELVQVNGSKSFKITDRTGEGFDKSRCYITDLAGNPLRNQTISDANLRLDSGAPEVARVEFSLSTNNSDVKQAQGKDKWDKDSEQYKKFYTDASDTHLGVGDSFYLIVHMSERLKGVERQSSGSLTWENAEFTTSLLDADDKPVTVSSWYFYPYNESQTEATQFVTHSITIQPGYHLAEDYEQIEVIKMEFVDGNGITVGDITDLAGNKLDKSNVKLRDNANNNPPYLDAAAPTVTVDGGYAAEGSGFRYGVKLNDTYYGTHADSGYAGIYGSFILNNNGDGKAYTYEWAVTAAPATTAETKWTRAVTGTAQEFIQTQDLYFHIRPVSGETYVDFSGCTITVKAKDLAGNESNVLLPPEGSTENQILWYIDNLAPTAAAGKVERSLKSDSSGAGMITVEVQFTDGRGISQWWYAWTESAETEPADADWQTSAFTPTTSDGATVSAVGDVAAKTLFSKYLWVRAADNIMGETKNTSAPICLGRFSYDLRDADYVLEYSNGIETYASLKASKLGSDDMLFFLVPAADGSEYCAVYQIVSAGGTAYNIFGQPIAEDAYTSLGWMFYQFAENSEGNYILTPDSEQRARNTLASILSGAASSGVSPYSGDLAVTVLAGKKTACDINSGVITLGNTENKFGKDTVNLRVAGYTADIFGAITLSCEDNNLGQMSGLSYWTTSSGYTQRTTLEGLRFTITIDGDKRGWKYENVDWQKSYIRFQNLSETGKYYDVGIGPFQLDPENPNGSVSQTVTVPKGDYSSGIYTATFYLVVKGGRNDLQALFTEGATYRKIVVDTKQPNSDFSLSSLIYDPQAQYDYLRKAYGLDQSYGEGAKLELITGGSGVIYLPISKSQHANQAYPKIATEEKYYLTITTPDEGAWTAVHGEYGAVNYVGRYSVQIWNAANVNHKVELTTNTDSTVVTTGDGRNENNGLSFVFTEDTALTGNQLYLTPNEVNTIAVQKLYENGRKSEIKYYQIMPVDEAVGGTISIDKSARHLVFTPDAGVSTAGTTVFAWVWQNDQDETKGEGKRVEMSAFADGTWRCALEENGASYEVITVSAHGALCEVGYMDQRAPWFDNLPQSDRGDVGLDNFVDHGNGTYTLKFRVRDDHETMKNGLTVALAFNEAYSRETFTFTYDGTDVYWTTNDGSPTGIYSVTAVKNVYLTGTASTSRDYLDVTVEGVFANVTGTMEVTVTATDAFGNAGAVSTSQPVGYVAPAVTSNTDHTFNTLTFNQPVRPVESWAWHEKDGDGFQTEWTGAFPIPGNGTWSIQYKDAFGQTHGAEVTTTDFTIGGTDYSIDLGFSTTDITSEAVTLTTNAANGAILVYEIVYDEAGHASWTTLIPVEGSPTIGTQKRQTVITENMETRVELNDADGNNILRLRVYIDNIVTGAPAAELHYYVEQLGQEFTAKELADYVGSGLSVTGSVRAWYTTERRVTPTGDTGSEFVFTRDNQSTTHTFTYEDDLGNPGSAEAKLPAGLTLERYVDPPEDKKAPDVSVDIYVLRGGVYTRAASFLPGDDVTAKLAALSYVQGYSLTVNASDESGFDITAEGGTLSGNVLTITEAGEVTIRVTDRSKNKNEAVMIFEVPDLIDTTAPTGTVTASADSLYTKKLTLVAVDTDNHGNVITNGNNNTVMLDAPTGAAAAGTNRFTYQALDNGTVHFLFRDIAGNTGEAEYSVTGIDTDPPQLTVHWSPSEKTVYNDDTKTWDDSTPPSEPLNTNVTARIESDKAMSSLTVRAGNETTEHTLLNNGVSTGYTIDGQNGALVTISATPELITVTFVGNYNQTLTFTATAPNGKSREVVINGVTIIDKDAPGVGILQKTSYDRSGKEVSKDKPAYSVFVVLVPNETVTSPNYGDWTTYGNVRRPVEYTSKKPLFLNFTANGTYNVFFADKAGNTTVVPITIDNIDNTAPGLTLGKPVISGRTATVKVTVDEACTVTWGDGTTPLSFPSAGSNTITITENGTYAVTATDAAGNETVRMLTVGSIDDIAPTISFTSGTIYVKAGDRSALDAALEAYEVRDNVSPEAELKSRLKIDTTGVRLDTAGEYTVTYTVTDGAGNSATATRIVRVIGADTVCINIDGKLIMPESTAVLRPDDKNKHTMTLENNTEPYTVKAQAGILSTGQMKYLSGGALSFDANGNFSVTTPGYYTLLVTTQSRQTIRILLYVER